MKKIIYTVIAHYLDSKSSVVKLKELARNSHEILDRLCSCIVIVSSFADLLDTLSSRKRFSLFHFPLSDASLNTNSDCVVTL